MQKKIFLLFTGVIGGMLLLAGCGSQETSASLAQKKAAEVIPVKTEYSGDQGFVGSEVCGDCHSSEYANWKQSSHSKMIQDAKKSPEVMVGDFSQSGNALEKTNYKKEDIVWTIGGPQYKQRYVVKDGEAMRILPAEWIVKDNKWVPYHPDDWNKIDYKETCISCHSTGYDAKSGKFKEMGVGCESCHGPGEKHAKNEKAEDIVNPAKLSMSLQSDLCGSCHIRGEGKVKNAEGKLREDAYGFLPGKKLTDYFEWYKPTGKDEKNFYENGDSKSHHQQYNDFVQSKHYSSGVVSCTSCHDTHTKSNKNNPHLTVAPDKIRDLCASCHYAEFKDIPASKFDIRQYMPEKVKNATKNDTSVHTFREPLKK